LFPNTATSGAASPAGKTGSQVVPDSDPEKPKEGNLRAAQPIETEAQALRDLTAMPIYFASSYSLVKPYVSGFDGNVLDAPSLKSVRIDTSWKQPAPPK
jgi:hypothetical protein